MQLGATQMVMQEPLLNAPESSTTKRPRSRKLIALIAGAAVLVIVAAIGVYFVAFRSLATTVSWAPSVSAMASGGDLTVSGQVMPGNSGRKVLVQSASSVKGPWKPLLPTVTTDSGGRFTGNFKPEFSGSIIMRVVVNPAGRYLKVVGEPARILSLSSINVKGGGAMPTQTPLTFTTTVDPISAGRTVRIEQSSDKVRWVPVGPSVQTKTDGSSVVKVPSPGLGAWSYRATVAKDDKFAAAVSPVVGATVEDIKAAGASYLRIIGRYNSALDVFRKAVDRANASPDVIGNLRLAAAPLSVVETKEASEFRAYGAWPQSVKPLIDQLIAQDVILADNMHQLSAATSVDSWNGLMAQGQAAGVESGRLSTLIRQALGLPQRPAN